MTTLRLVFLDLNFDRGFYLQWHRLKDIVVGIHTVYQVFEWVVGWFS